jgi:hypothetical protein
MNCKSRFPKLEELHRAFPGWLIMLRRDAWMFVPTSEIRRPATRRIHRLIRKAQAVAHLGGWQEFIKSELELAQAMPANADNNSIGKGDSNYTQTRETLCKS